MLTLAALLVAIFLLGSVEKGMHVNSMSNLASQIIIPIMALFLGLFANGWWANQTLSVQELALAIQVKGSEKQDKMTLEWAEKTIARYTKRPEAKSVFVLSGDYFPVSREMADDVCIFPIKELQDLPPFFLDKEGNLVGQNAKLLLFKTVAAYRDASRRYNSLTTVLRESCGFLPKIEKELLGRK